MCKDNFELKYLKRPMKNRFLNLKEKKNLQLKNDGCSMNSYVLEPLQFRHNKVNLPCSV